MIWVVATPVSPIASGFEDITRSAVSQYLGGLRARESIIVRRHGVKRRSGANHNEMGRLRNVLDDVWSESLERLRELAEGADPGPAPSAPKIRDQ